MADAIHLQTIFKENRALNEVASTSGVIERKSSCKNFLEVFNFDFGMIKWTRQARCVLINSRCCSVIPSMEK